MTGGNMLVGHDDGEESDLLGHILANLSWHLVANVTRHLGANLEIDFVNIQFVQFQENIGKTQSHLLGHLPRHILADFSRNLNLQKKS